MRLSPRDRRKLRLSRFKKWFSLCGDGAAFFSPDHVRLNPVPCHAAYVGKVLGVEQGDQPMKGIGFFLVRGRRQHEEIRCGLAQPLAQFEPGHLVGTAAKPVSLVHDHQVPSRRNQVLEAFLVVAGHLCRRPSLSLFQWLDGVHRHNGLVKHFPGIGRQRFRVSSSVFLVAFRTRNQKPRTRNRRNAA